ncbi:MAG: hypothetical protein E6Q97_30540 [Desulfurellales bacterium]|nr:MAG: hypothetical protein E6Q97_30540 [Desulfurellales bacterium]
MVASIRVTKVDTRKLRQLKQQIPDRFDGLIRGAAEEMTGDIKVSFGTSPPGETYTRGSVSHVASQPGYPPNIDIGTLRASIRWLKDRRGRYIITDGVIYGAHLEIGTEAMEARPWMTPVIEEWRNKKFAEYARNNNIFY